MDRPDIHIHRDAGTLFQASAELIAAELKTALLSLPAPSYPPISFLTSLIPLCAPR